MGFTCKMGLDHGVGHLYSLSTEMLWPWTEADAMIETVVVVVL